MCLRESSLQLVINTRAKLRYTHSLGVSRMARYEKLSDELILPNLGKNISFLRSRHGKLRKRFEIYPQGLDATVTLANDLDRTRSELLERIQAERQQR